MYLLRLFRTLKLIFSAHLQCISYLTACRISCVQASALAGTDNHNSWYSNSSRKWLPSYSWHTTASSSFHPQPAVSPPPSASSPQKQAFPSLAPNSASFRPWLVLDADIKHNHVLAKGQLYCLSVCLSKYLALSNVCPWALHEILYTLSRTHCCMFWLMNCVTAYGWNDNKAH